MIPTNFENTWDLLISTIKPNQRIRNWTANKGYLGDMMTIVSADFDSIHVDAPGAKNLQFVPKKDFEALWSVWKDYKAGIIQRQEIRDITRYSKYIISIFHWLETDAFAEKTPDG